MLRNRVAPDSYIYTSLIDGFMRCADISKAEDMFRLMLKKRIKPSLVTYNVLMYNSVKQLDMASALKFWGNLLEAGLKADVYTFAIILHGLGQESRIDEAWRVFELMQNQRVDVNEIVATTLMGMHVKQNDNEYAVKLFNEFFNLQSPHKLKPTNHKRGHFKRKHRNDQELLQ
jgi:pentatricopeptide repeat protein